MEGDDASQDGNGEYVPIEKMEDLPEEHQRQFVKIIEDLKKKLLAMYTKSCHGSVRIHGVPTILLD